MQHKRVLTTSALAIMTLCGLAAADDVRWINTAGGEWDDSANWDPPRVPIGFDTVVFDLDAAYTVTVCGDRPGAWSALVINNSRVTFDLCGESFISRPFNGDKKAPVLVEIGTGAVVPTEVVFANGSFIDPDGIDGINEFFMQVGAAGMPATRMVVSNDAEWGTLPQGDVDFLGFSELVSAGPLALRYSSLNIGRDAHAEITGDISLSSSSFNVQGEVDLDAAVVDIEVLESTSSGTGSVRMRDGSSYFVYTFGIGFVLEGAAQHTGGFASSGVAGCRFDLRQAAADTNSVRQNYDNIARGATFVYGPDNHGGGPICTLERDTDTDRYGWLGCVFMYESDENVKIGTAELVGRWRVFPLDFAEPVAIEVQMIADISGSSAEMRWGPIGPSLLGVYILGVPDDWCPADVDLNGVLNFFDIARFIDEYNAGSAWANINNDVFVNEEDVTEFVSVFVNGCP